MDFALRLALRYMGSRKRASISVSTGLAVIGVALGTCVLTLAITVTGGFREEFRNKVLGVNAHVLVLKYASDFREYRDVMEQMRAVEGVKGVAPFVINPMMVTHEKKTATGVLLKGVDPELFGTVLDLPQHIVQGNTRGLRLAGAKPPKRTRRTYRPSQKSSALDLPVDLDGALKKSTEGDAGAGSGDPLDALDDPFEELVASAPGTSPAPAAPTPEPDAVQPHKPEGGDTEAEPELLPEGEIAPDGGYKSQLPSDEEDLMGDLGDIDPDPCRDASTTELPGIIVGITLKQSLGVELGDCIVVTSPTIGFTYNRGGFQPPVAKQFRVIAVFDAGFDQYDSKLVYTDLYEAQAFHDSGDSVTGVEMKVENIDEAGEVKARVDAALGSGAYHTMDWEELNHGLFTALRIQQIMVSLALGLIILVAAFTPMATLIMVVLDKKQEIAVMKAMGATGWQIVRAFLYQGTIIGIVGSLLGLGLGFAVCKYMEQYPFPLDPKVYFISHLPVTVRPGEFVMTGLFALLVCLLGSVWPALHAARLRPADAFREL